MLHLYPFMDIHAKLYPEHEAIRLGETARHHVQDGMALVQSRSPAGAVYTTADRDHSRPSATSDAGRLCCAVCAGVERRPEARPGTTPWPLNGTSRSARLRGLPFRVGNRLRSERASSEAVEAAG